MESKGDIRKRMISAAASSWGINVRDLAKADPLIPLLIDACASEVERVSSSIEDARNTMGDKLMELLTPESLLSPFPARSILYAHPFDASFVISPEHQFYTSKENPFEDDGLPIEIFFTPTANQMLINGEIKYLAANKSLYQFDSPLEKKTLIKSTGGKTLPPDCIWLGLSLNKAVDSLDEMSLFFELEHVDEDEAKAFYHALASSSWDLNDVSFTSKSGFEARVKGFDPKQLHLPHGDFNKARAISKHITDFYKHKYITLFDKKGSKDKYGDMTEAYPSIFEEVFEKEALEEEMGKKILWFRLSFTQHIPRQLLDSVSCSLNCIPVVNRKAERMMISGRERIKELFAEVHEQFFDLRSLSAEDKLKIIFEQKKSGDLEGKALFSLRKDNIGRFDKRNALETIRHLNDVFNEEYAAFSKIRGLDHDQLDELNKAIWPFESVFEEMYQSSSNSMPYAMLKTETENEDTDIEIQYWLTNGILANGFRVGEGLRFDSAELNRDNIVLLTETIGGTDQKRSDELVHEFKYALLSNDRIASLEDVKALCYKQFGKYVDTIEVQQGVDADARPGSGLRRIIDINILLKAGDNIPAREIEYLKADLELQLQERSLNALPFKVSIGK